MITVKRKLVITNVSILLLAITSFGINTYFALNRLADKFIGLSAQRANAVKESYQKNSDENILKIRGIYENNLKIKGSQILSKDSISLAPMIADNSFMGVREFLKRNFKEDRDLVLATYFSANATEIKAWYFIDSEHKEPLKGPNYYDIHLQGWKAKLKDGKPFILSDPFVLEAIKLNEISVRFRKYEIGGKKKYGFDCVIPFVAGRSGKAVKDAKLRNEPIGYLRYILSPDEMNRAIASEKLALEQHLHELESDNQSALKISQNLVKSSSLEVLRILLIVALIILIVSVLVAVLRATQITIPLQALTKTAESMADGDYKQKIDVKSNDEVGHLASAFQKMSLAIQKRDEDLAAINKSLEKKVEFRTAQLKDENRKISALLDNMKQSVFAVSADYRVVAPVSRFSNEVFGMPLEGELVFDFLCRGLDPKSEMVASFKAAIKLVYGAGDLQWDLVEDSFPRRIVLENVQGLGEQVLRVSYSPLYDEERLVDRIMFVVEDITKVENLEKEVSVQREKAELISRLTGSNLDIVKIYFSSSSKMLSEIFRILRSTELTAGAVTLSLRHLHTIKGNSGTLNFDSVASAAHDVENDLEPLRKYLFLPENTVLQYDEEKILKNGIVRVKREIDKYLCLASQLFGIKDELRMNITSEYYDGFSQICWDSEVPIDALENLSKIAAELGSEQLAQLLGNLSRIEISEDRKKALPQVVPGSVALLFESPLFTAHTRLPEQCVSLGLVLWHLNQELHKYSFTHLQINGELALLEVLEEICSFAESNGFYFYAGTARRMKHLVSTRDEVEIFKLERDLWQQYFLAARIQTNFETNSEELACLRTVVKDLLHSDKSQEEILLKTISYPCWILSLFRTLLRKQLDVREYLQFWADQQGATIHSFAQDLVGPTDLLEDQTSNDLVSVMSLIKNEKPLKGKLWERDPLRMGNAYLQFLDKCQILAGLNNSTEYLQNRYKTIEVLSLNYIRMKNDLSIFLESIRLSQNVIQEIYKKTNRLLESPVKPLIWSYKKMVEATASLLRKKVELIVQGEDVTLPREVLADIQDSFVHLIRNSIDHGIEVPSVREAAKKNPVGKLEFLVRDTEVSTIIRVRDDGGGVDPEHILKLAVEKQLLSEIDTLGLDRSQKLALIFIPGFSTKDEVSELSGRGIGLDVVKKNIETLGGNLAVASELGQGTTFEISLPK